MSASLLPTQVREIIPFESRFAEVCGHRLHLTADEHAVVEHAGEPGPAEEVERDLWLRRRVDSRMRLADNLRRRWARERGRIRQLRGGTTRFSHTTREYPMFEKIGALLLTALLASIIVSCASAGRKLDRTHLGEIQEGVQSKQQIREWFGDPYTEVRGLHGHVKGCVDRWLFEYAKARGRAGTVTYTETLVVDFDAKGIVCDHAFAQSGQE